MADQDQAQQTISKTASDGSVHNFPAGTDPGVVSRVVGSYEESQAAKNPPVNSTIQTAARQMHGGPTLVTPNLSQPLGIERGVPSQETEDRGDQIMENMFGQKNAGSQNSKLKDAYLGRAPDASPDVEQMRKDMDLRKLAGGMAMSLAPEAAIEAPIKTLLTLGAGVGGQKLGQMGTSLFTDDPTTQNFVGDVGGMGAGMGMFGLADAAGNKIEANRSPEGKLASASKLSKRALYPESIKAGDEPQVDEEFNRVQKHVGQYTAPADKGGTPIEKGPGGALRVAQTARQASQNLWDENVQPVIEKYAGTQRSTPDIKQSILSTISDTDRQVNPARAAATDKLAAQYGDQSIKTVKQMSDRVTELNNDKAVVRFNGMDANEQSQALLGDPSLRGKVAELNALRGKMFNTIGQEGGEALGSKFEESRKDWGALRSYEDRVMNTKVPTPQPVLKRLANTARATVGAGGPHFYARNLDTLFGTDNPNKLLPRAFNKIGEANAARPASPLVFAQPKPTPLMLPAAGGAGSGSAPLGGAAGVTPEGQARGLFERGTVGRTPDAQPVGPTARLPRETIPPTPVRGSTMERKYAEPRSTFALEKQPGTAPTNELRSGREVSQTTPAAQPRGSYQSTGTAPKGPSAPTTPKPANGPPFPEVKLSEKANTALQGSRMKGGPPIERTAIWRHAQSILDDPTAEARDKMIARETLRHLRNTTFEGWPVKEK